MRPDSEVEEMIEKLRLQIKQTYDTQAKVKGEHFITALLWARNKEDEDVE